MGAVLIRADRRTNGTSMIKLIGAFRDYANAPKPVQNVVFLCQEVKI
jgi:hypothetical protein